jgi:hypothetical protein
MIFVISLGLLGLLLVQFWSFATRAGDAADDGGGRG